MNDCLYCISCMVCYKVEELRSRYDVLRRPYHTVLLLEDERSLLSSLPIDASPSLIRFIKVANPLKNLHSLSLDADVAVEQVRRRLVVLQAS